MIKSSDKELNNTYRILKLLANQDYLAIDQNNVYCIFSQINNNNDKNKGMGIKKIYKKC